MNRQDVQTYLRQAPAEELLEILRAVFETRQPNPEEAAYNRNRFFLATASSLREETGEWRAWHIEAVAYRDPNHWPEGNLGPDWGFCQFGTCLGCGTDVRSNVKDGICPVCGAKVRMT